MTPVLSVKNLQIRFGSQPLAVDDVSFDIAPGEVFGLVGESGSGKSTIANAVMGLLPPSAKIAGEIEVDGQETLGRDENALRQMRGKQAAMIFQDASASLDPTWPVGAQIAETILAHQSLSRPAARDRAIALMEQVGIADAANRYRDPPHRFSGGMRQRIVIAAALANNPQLLIADEPTTALDVTIQAQVLSLIDKLRREFGTTVLLITHDLGVVAQVCDRVGVMYRGGLLEVSKAQDLFSRPTHPYTRALLAASPTNAPRGARLPVIPPEWSVEDTGQTLRAAKDGKVSADG